ncbi:MAG TPA: CBS domain-containing protein [Acidimicrobiales bacterium]|nr:CBS domain-containing protein [Acidimicrobiales bacterium]
MKVADVMSAPAVSVHPDLPLKQIARLMLVQGVSGVAVVDEHHALLGVVTEADLISHEAYHGGHSAWHLVAEYFAGHDPRWVRKASGRTASEVMTSVVVSVSPTADLSVAARLMLEHSVRRLPVLDDDQRLVGMLSRRDLLRFFWPGDDQVGAAVQRLLDDPFNGPERYDVTFTVIDGVVKLHGEAQFESDVTTLLTLVEQVPGVVAVEGDLHARRRDPHVFVPLT